MSSAAILSFILFTFAFTYLLFKLFFHPKQKHKKPPGPPTLPIIGNLHMLGKLPHRTLQSLSKKYGPIMSLQLGQVPTVVISSSKTAELFLKTHDLVFASRPKIQASEIFSYGSVGLSFSEYGPYWRSARKLSTLKLLSASKVEMFAPIRKDELDAVVKSLEKAALVGEVVNVSDVVETLIEDIMYKMVLGRSKYPQFDLKRIVKQTLILFGAFNIADYVTWLGYLDLQGITRACKKTSKELDQVLEVIVSDHEEATNVDKPHHEEDFVDMLLSTMHQTVDLENENNNVINRTNIKAILLDLIVAGIDTSATVIEWTLCELLRNPKVMKNLQDEIQNEVGHVRMIEESDLKKLNYLDMVVDEILRLYPIAPLLIPRECRENIIIDGYFIEKKTRVIVNAWAIGRDHDVWSQNAEEFYPERFIDKKMNFHGQEFECIPFGSGRRRCPGIHLGLITVKMVIAQLVHCFNWELPHNITPSNLNMEEIFGLTMPRAQQLHAIPSYRLGITRACKKTSKEFDEVLEVIIADHEQVMHHEEDFLDMLLSTMHQTIDLENEQNNVINRTNIKATLLDLLVSGIDTSATVIDWALSELLRNTRVMKNLRDEIQNEVGHMRMVEENDLKKLNYIWLIRY